MPNQPNDESNDRSVVSEARRQIGELLQMHRQHVNETKDLQHRVDQIYDRIMAGGVLLLPRHAQRKPIAQRGKWRHP